MNATENLAAAQVVAAQLKAATNAAERLAFAVQADIATKVRAICAERGCTRLVLNNAVLVTYGSRGFYWATGKFSTPASLAAKQADPTHSGLTYNNLYIGELEYFPESYAVAISHHVNTNSGLAYGPDAISTRQQLLNPDADANQNLAIWHLVGHHYDGPNSFSYEAGDWAAGGKYAAVLVELEAGRYTCHEARLRPTYQDDEDIDTDETSDAPGDREQYIADLEEAEAVGRELYG